MGQETSSCQLEWALWALGWQPLAEFLLFYPIIAFFLVISFNFLMLSGRHVSRVLLWRPFELVRKPAREPGVLHRLTQKSTAADDPRWMEGERVQSMRRRTKTAFPESRNVDKVSRKAVCRLIGVRLRVISTLVAAVWAIVTFRRACGGNSGKPHRDRGLDELRDRLDDPRGNSAFQCQLLLRTMVDVDAVG